CARYDYGHFDYW
nr:immunoglobulin heavy chain junction region [Mus musculus]